MTLVTIPKIPILEVGMEWPAASGPATVTFEDLESIVSSQEDSEISGARLKIGHWDLPDGLVFAAEPSLGTFCNYSIVDGITLEADLVGCPEWFAEIMPTCFPNRSIEGYQQFKTQRQKTYPMVLTAVALLGVEPQAITSLPDLYEFMNADTPPVTIMAGGGMPTIKARTNVEDVRRAFYEDVAVGDQFWWWIRAVELDPENQLIVDDDEGCLYRIPFSMDGEDGIEFGDPIEVEVEYNDVAAAYATSGEARMVAIFATAAQSRPDDHQKETKPMPETKARRPSKRTAAGAVEEPEPGTTPPEDDEDTEDEPLDDGDDDSGAETPGGGTGPDDPSQPADTTMSNVKVPKGFALVPEATLNDLKAGARMGAEARQVQLDRERDGKIDAAVRAGKFAPAQVEHFKALWASDPKGTEAIIDALAEDVIPVSQRSVGGGEEQAVAASATYPSSWLSATEAAAVAARNGG